MYISKSVNYAYLIFIVFLLAIEFSKMPQNQNFFKTQVILPHIKILAKQNKTKGTFQKFHKTLGSDFFTTMLIFQ
uniref:Uncharacterized protein n=1 Tax=Panagrolaimus sp. PS1159 TaxID=55785 RepID=A0AC35G4J9_9BILA